MASDDRVEGDGRIERWEAKCAHSWENVVVGRMGSWELEDGFLGMSGVLTKKTFLFKIQCVLTRKNALLGKKQKKKKRCATLETPQKASLEISHLTPCRCWFCRKWHLAFLLVGKTINMWSLTCMFWENNINELTNQVNYWVAKYFNCL